MREPRQTVPEPSDRRLHRTALGERPLQIARRRAHHVVRHPFGDAGDLIERCRDLFEGLFHRPYLVLQGLGSGHYTTLVICLLIDRPHSSLWIPFACH